MGPGNNFHFLFLQLRGDATAIGFWSADPEVTLDSLVFTKTTPHRVANKSWAGQGGIAPPALQPPFSTR
jgi:hypothetical protein